ncbi:ATP-binding protein [Kitasatospora sp. NPDC058170]|uniref:sensor histidine kinase n=1 Tax=Kitasatospora sp. NPDC058170 TaxID=3346364 RepID=UPI0036DDF974
MTTVTSPRFRTPARPRRPDPDRRARRQLSAAAAVMSLCLALATLWACYVLAHLGDPGVAQTRDQLAVLAYALPTAAAGMLLHAHRPGSPLGWVMLAYALAAILPKAAAAPVWVEVTDPGIVGAVTVLKAVCDTVRETLFFVLPLWLPSGRLTDRRWWWYIGAVALWETPIYLSYMGESELFGRPNPLADTPPARFLMAAYERLGGYDDQVFYVLVGIAAAVLLTRMLRAAPGARLRIGLMLGAYLLWAGMQDYYTRAPDDDYWLAYALFAAAGVVWAVAITYLVVKDGGWRLDRAARRILSGLLLATGLTTLFVVFAAVLSSWLVPGRGAAALVLIALVFALGSGLPRAARWAVGLVDRLYYGERAQPYQVLRTLAERVRQVVDPQQLPSALCATVAQELRLPGVALTVSTRAGQRPLAAVGRLDGPRQDFALVHHGTVIGELTVGLRAGEERLDASDVDILRSLADQASPAVASLRLQEDLQASREQIVAAREEERRWLRRDIHDGLGPALAGLRLRVDNAGAALAAQAPLSGTLRGISGDLAMAIKEVRRITDRLGPAPLGELGLARAIQQLSATFNGAGLTVTAELSPDPLPELPAAVEVAVYRITAEALNNVLRHARAHSAQVRVQVQRETLTLVVQDDGVGYRGLSAGGSAGGSAAAGGEIDAPSAGGTGSGGEHGTAGTEAGAGGTEAGSGVGLRSMSDRAAEIGGRCTVGPLEHGTRVLAVLPRYPSHAARE